MNPKVLSAIKAIIMAAITTLSFFGLGHIIEPLELFLEQLPILWESIMIIVGIVGLFIPYLKKTDEQTKGQMIRKEFESKPSAQSSDKRKAYFNYRG